MMAYSAFSTYKTGKKGATTNSAQEIGLSRILLNATIK